MNFRALISHLVLLSVGCVLLQGCEQSASSPHNEAAVKPLLTLPQLALKDRKFVEGVIGKPKKYERRKSLGEIGDMASYPWGYLLYANGVLVSLVRVNPPQPYQQAFAELGLPSPNEPYTRSVDGTLIWAQRLFGTGFACCEGLIFDDIFFSGDKTELHVSLLDADDPKGWTDSECLEWLKFSNVPLPRKALQRGNILDWPLHPSNSPEDCKSKK